MTAKQMEKIFLPFEQVGDAKKQAEGTGLGLAISRKVVSLMNSTLEVQSQVGQGSLFWFDVTLSTAQHWGPSAQLLEADKVVGFEGPSRRILVIDDGQENRSVLVNLLKPLGFEVIEADDGETGSAMVETHRPNLVIVDLTMPGTDSYKLLRQLRQLPESSRLPAIASSASVFEHNRNKSLAAGANAFLPKPVELHTLLELVGQQLSLTWVYQTQAELDTPVASASANVAPKPTEILPPPAHELTQLYKLAQQGRVQALKRCLNNLEQLDSEYIPFSQAVRQLTKGFQIEAIQSFLQQCMEDPST
jgi:CheY-like chemotaxis protein